mmetsp:Transcript_29950/g.75467  ORF Transcript_29950/g.75467 Transcript_29950/m.75467 type:complete len:304 (+) Transcript_29950:55-966(+)
MQEMRSVSRILPPAPPHWVGDGFHVHPVFHNLAFKEALSPWLMFDYATPKEFSPTRKRRGVGQHPHRGFETITIAFQGEVEHADSVGNRDVIGPGDVQWMTAGRGIIHEEYHSAAFAKQGGTLEMTQLWLNLPRKRKMEPPGYQPILAKDIPIVPLAPANATMPACPADGSFVKVIAGEYNGVQGPARTFSPVELWDITLKRKGGSHELTVPGGHNVIVFVRRGSALVGPAGAERVIEPQGVALMEREGTSFRVVAGEEDTQLLLLGGQPLNEPIAHQGPFVMNTARELDQAWDDFHSKRMGK